MELKEAQVKILKVLFYGQLLLEANDDLARTPFFKHKLKSCVNRANEEVERQIKHQLAAVYEKDNETCTNIFNHIDEFVGRVSSLGVDEIPLVNKMLDAYLEDPENWKENLKIEFSKVD